MLYKKIAKPLLFRMDPERAHHLIIDRLGQFTKLPLAASLLKGMYGTPPRPELAQRLWGIDFANPIGLAAGLDKNAAAVKGFSAMGFGFIEVGTVTPLGQPGNELPRLFRLPEDLALINRMGFNNVGADRMAEQLARLGGHPVPIAVNIGKNKVTPNEEAEQDYRACIRKLYPYGDFFVVNISSPNTPDLRKLQLGDDLKRLLKAVMDEMEAEGRKHASRAKPVLVKIAPDMSEEELEMTAAALSVSGVSGIIATNTTIGRDGLTHRNARETGGLSGRPLTERSTQVIRSLYRFTQGKLPIIGSGGVFTAEDAYAKIKAGASLVEIYTALIYEGPGIAAKINKGMLELLRKDGITQISQAVGTGN